MQVVAIGFRLVDRWASKLGGSQTVSGRTGDAWWAILTPERSENCLAVSDVVSAEMHAFNLQRDKENAFISTQTMTYKGSIWCTRYDPKNVDAWVRNAMAGSPPQPLGKMIDSDDSSLPLDRSRSRWTCWDVFHRVAVAHRRRMPGDGASRSMDNRRACQERTSRGQLWEYGHADDLIKLVMRRKRNRKTGVGCSCNNPNAAI
ncbi:hypothetical protein BJX96DRAFT_17375 [Aspergillus floccosus]